DGLFVVGGPSSSTLVQASSSSSASAPEVGTLKTTIPNLRCSSSSQITVHDQLFT
ncbi:unnamed protein product, partial [Amoebophrya sp. A25]